MAYYVATLANYVLVDAADEAEARDLGANGLRALLGPDYPVQIRTVRLTTDDEVELQRWQDETMARELGSTELP